MQTDEKRLIARASAGDSGAFRQIVEQFKRPVYTLALDLTGNQHDAEDLSQEVFIRVFRGLEKFRGDAKLASWLYRITVNVYINQTRKKSLKNLVFRQDFDDRRAGSDAFSGENFCEDPERSTESRLIHDHIQKALQKLTPRERAIFVLRHYDDLPLKEIAATLNLAEGTVKSLIFRALKRLQKELAFYRPARWPKETL